MSIICSLRDIRYYIGGTKSIIIVVCVILTGISSYLSFNNTIYSKYTGINSLYKDTKTKFLIYRDLGTTYSMLTIHWYSLYIYPYLSLKCNVTVYILCI